MKLNLLLGFLLLSLGGMAEAQLTITMRVVNDARVPGWILGKAEKDAEYILQQAGVEVAWQHCPPRSVLDGPLNPCHRNFSPTEFWYASCRRNPRLSGMTPSALPSTSQSQGRAAATLTFRI
jgi:hypothetical protein